MSGTIPRPTSLLIAIVDPVRCAIAPSARVEAVRIDASVLLASSMLDTHSVRQSIITKDWSGHFFIALQRSSGSSIVDHPGRSALCLLIRPRISSSSAWAVATKNTGFVDLLASSTANELFPLRAPPSRSVKPRAWFSCVSVLEIDSTFCLKAFLVSMFYILNFAHSVSDIDQ